MKYITWKQIAASVSVANLICYPSWSYLLYSDAERYTAQEMPSWMDFIAVWIIVVSLSAVILVIVTGVRYFFRERSHAIVRIGLFLTILLILNEFRVIFFTREEALVSLIGSRLIYQIGLVTFVSAYFLVWIKNFDGFNKLHRTLVLILVPFVFVTFLRSSLYIFEDLDSENSQTTESSASFNSSSSDKKGKSERIIWIIFDELDYDVTFEKRPPELKLPNLDKFRKETFFATDAHSPAMNTLLSIPALLTGDRIKSATESGRGNLNLTFYDESEMVKFSETETVFDDMRKTGARVDLVGYYHPYCRIFADQVATCFRVGSYNRSDRLQTAISRRIYEIAIALPLGFRIISSPVFSWAIPISASEERRRKTFPLLWKNSQAVLLSKKSDLVFLHLALPHSPYIYNPERDDLSGGESYIDNLALTDKIVGELRKSLTEKDLWNETTLIISSDHPWRISTMNKVEKANMQGNAGQKIPFFLKLKGQQEGVEYSKRFNTIETRKLIKAIREGRIKSKEDIGEWISKGSPTENK